MAQTAEGALGKVGDMLQRMRELAVQAANGTNSTSDRSSLNNEYLQLAQESARTLGGTQFNGQNILATTATSTFQIGANTDANLDQIQVAAFDWTAVTSIVDAVGLAVGTDPTIALAGTDGSFATSAITALDLAITSINAQRATFGAVQNRFDNVVSNLMVSSENQNAARSRIMDADYAVETASLSRAQILQQAGNAMLAQANQLPQQVLALLQR
jgi:flagellin